MHYAVQIVADHELPAGVTRVVVERPDTYPLILLSGAAARAWEFMRAADDLTESPAGFPVRLAPWSPHLRAV